ncbi:hypothetical protein OHA98_41755 [Streptomyces sp. NBC_00654]|nr:hypothetical protein [Streptomyces sp. NBC_00654]MCX4971133.1 hypothetical protein [Streptomyces sp. NBC_00654]
MTAHAHGRGQWVVKKSVSAYVEHLAYAVGNVLRDRRSFTGQQRADLALRDADGVGELPDIQ